MKKLLFISLCIIFYTSCASSQSALINREAQQKVDKVKTLINLTDEQVKKMVGIEKEYIARKKKLTYSATYNSRLKALQDQRISAMKQILTRDQFIKLDLIENNRIKNVPIRAN